ncbi:MAG: SDR family oxidoreductase [Anaerolineae bacterium]|nr:SDR family oxidoreductase [Anaerolineae bacterium]
MADNVVLITGATNGIGRVAAQSLAQMGATVVIVGRNPDKTERVVKEIRQATGNQQVEMLLGDLSVVEDMRRVANQFRNRYDRLDVLANNAGAMFNERQVTPDGFEKTFALNHLSYFVITTMLLDMLRASAPARIVNTSSQAHRMTGELHFDDLQHEHGYNAWNVYSQSKLMNILFTVELARRLEGTGVTANSFHPGFVNSGFGKNNGGLMRLAMQMITPLFGRSPEQGAETLIYLASSPDVAQISGAYFVDKQTASPSSTATDTAAARKLWDISESLAGVQSAGV